MFDMTHYVKFTCWTSILAILWGLITGAFEPNAEVVSAFAFFCLMGLASWSVGR